MVAVVAACKDLLEMCGFGRAVNDADDVHEKAQRVHELAYSTCEIIDRMRFTSDYWRDTFAKVRDKAWRYVVASGVFIDWAQACARDDWYGMIAEARRLTDAANDHVQDAHACKNGECFHDVLLSAGHARALAKAAKSLLDGVPVVDDTYVDACTEIAIAQDEADSLHMLATAGILGTLDSMKNAAAERAFFGPVPEDLTGVR
jgi:hypothetical protein